MYPTTYGDVYILDWNSFNGACCCCLVCDANCSDVWSDRRVDLAVWSSSTCFDHTTLPPSPSSGVKSPVHIGCLETLEWPALGCPQTDGWHWTTVHGPSRYPEVCDSERGGGGGIVWDGGGGKVVRLFGACAVQQSIGDRTEYHIVWNKK